MLHHNVGNTFRRTHNHSGNRPCGVPPSPEYRAWTHMRTRCYNEKSPDYPNYGGRGIKVIFTFFEEFLAEVGLRPSTLHSIDRIDNNKNYEPGNVKWSTRKEQNKNKRNCKKIQIGKQIFSYKEACKFAGVPYGTVVQRVNVYK